jgi:hypothetical protein
MAKCTERNTEQSWPAFKTRSVIARCCLQQGQVNSYLAEASLHCGSQIFSLSLRGHFLSAFYLPMIKQISNQSICLCMHLPTACTWCVIGAKPSHRLLVLSHAHLCGDGWIYLAVDTACMPMADSLPSSVIDGIDSHIRNIEKARALCCALMEHQMPVLNVATYKLACRLQERPAQVRLAC